MLHPFYRLGTAPQCELEFTRVGRGPWIERKPVISQITREGRALSKAGEISISVAGRSLDPIKITLRLVYASPNPLKSAEIPLK